MANAAAAMFKNLLELKDMTSVFLDEDESVLRAGFRFASGTIEVFFVFDNDCKSVHIVGKDFINGFEDNKRGVVLETLNECNRSFRWVKFSLSESGDIRVEDDAVIQLDSCAEECMELLGRMIQIVEKAHPRIMKAIWA